MTQVFVWTSADVAALIFCVLWAVLLIPYYLMNWWKNLRCKHDKVWENQACNAICRKCGKDLGFIGKWRDRK
jgi:hypothetical protein